VDTSRDQHEPDFITLSGSEEPADEPPIFIGQHTASEDSTLGMNFVNSVNTFTSRLIGPLPQDLAALAEYHQNSLVIMRMAIREVVRSVETRLGLGREGIIEEEGFQSWANGMLALFEMIDKALYCRIEELKYLVEEKGEVVEGIVDGMMVLAPGLLRFDVTHEKTDVVEYMLAEAKVIHRELMDFRKVRDRLKEVVDQWYEGSSWIDWRDGTDTDETASNGISENARAARDHRQELPDLPTSIQDSYLSPTRGEVSPIEDIAQALDTALRQHFESDERILENSDQTDALLSESEVDDIRPNEEDVSSDIGEEVQREADILWARDEGQFQADIKHDECSADNDDLTEQVELHEEIEWVKGEERDFIKDVDYHEKEIWNWEDVIEMQRDLELDEILFWESDEGRERRAEIQIKEYHEMLFRESDVGREVMADLPLDQILFWENYDERELRCEMEIDEYLMSISEEAIEHQREFDLERWVAEEEACWREQA
jgi:hypothetical protein